MPGRRLNPIHIPALEYLCIYPLQCFVAFGCVSIGGIVNDGECRTLSVKTCHIFHQIDTLVQRKSITVDKSMNRVQHRHLDRVVGTCRPFIDNFLKATPVNINMSRKVAKLNENTKGRIERDAPPLTDKCRSRWIAIRETAIKAFDEGLFSFCVAQADQGNLFFRIFIHKQAKRQNSLN